MRSRPLVSVFLVAICVGALPAQTTQTPDKAAQIFRASTRLVEVSVVVQDDRGRPVVGLTKDDFQLFEDRNEQVVSLMHVRREEEPEAEAAHRGVFTNRIQSTAGGGVVALIFDVLNTKWSDQHQAHQHILKFLAQLHPQDRVALYVLHGNGIDVVHDFTRDASSLLEALARTRAREPIGPGRLPAGAMGTAGEAVDKFVLQSFAGMKDFYHLLRANVTLESLEAIAAHLQGVPGRKNLVWISSGFPYYIGDRPPMNAESRRASRALGDSDIAVYPVDTRGLITGTGSALPSLRPQQEIFDGARYVSDLTGGRAFYNTNDLGGAIKQAVEDSRLSYILGYYPANENWDGKFREIKVKVRRPGVQVRHRWGYYAVSPGQHTLPRERIMANAAAAALEATGLPFSVTAQRQNGSVRLALHFDAGTPSLQLRDRAWQGAIDIAVSQQLASGKLTRDLDTTVPFALDGTGRSRLLAERLRLDRAIRLHPEAREIRIVAGDANSRTVRAIFVAVSSVH